MKISIHVEPQMGYTYEDIVVLTKAAEDAGFYRFTISDHFFGNEKSTERQSSEAWTTIALLTPQTRSIRLSTQVTSQSYRNPALLAKIIANLDIASNGRIDLGIGAGWKKSEYEAYGYPFPSVKTRILQLREALQIINLLWTEERPSFDGVFYKIKETMFLPKPIQKPRIPIWVGTETLKAPMMEETAAKYADGLDYVGATPEDINQKKERMRVMCENVGRDYSKMMWSVGVMAIVLGEDNDNFEERKEQVLNQQWPDKTLTQETKEKWLEKVITKEIAGPPDVVIDKLSKYKDEVDVVNICLPFIGDLRENGLDTIKILKESIINKL
ncbi:LLM class flavin-dependent oxidoreductase [Candidatus Thorarchaeota archaeon]|nr:MAG: LLM class flavin-dependent oxidoreductase [Candidatus Thorarchaeota archaeon]